METLISWATFGLRTGSLWKALVGRKTRRIWQVWNPGYFSPKAMRCNSKLLHNEYDTFWYTQSKSTTEPRLLRCAYFFSFSIIDKLLNVVENEKKVRDSDISGSHGRDYEDGHLHCSFYELKLKLENCAPEKTGDYFWAALHCFLSEYTML